MRVCYTISDKGTTNLQDQTLASVVQEGEDGGEGGAVVRCPDTGPLPPAAGGQAGHRAHLHEAEGGHPASPRSQLLTNSSWRLVSWILTSPWP